MVKIGGTSQPLADSFLTRAWNFTFNVSSSSALRMNASRHSALLILQFFFTVTGGINAGISSTLFSTLFWRSGKHSDTRKLNTVVRKYATQIKKEYRFNTFHGFLRLFF